MSYDILTLLMFMIRVTFFAFFARYFLEFLIPKEKRGFYDSLTQAIRQSIITFAEGIFPYQVKDRDMPRYNLEVVLLTRFFFPFLVMSYIYSSFYVILNTFVYNRLLLTSMFLFLFDVYLFLNIAPNIYDFAYLHDSEGFQLYMGKLLVLYYLYDILPPLLLIFLLLAPISLLVPDHSPVELPNTIPPEVIKLSDL